MRNKQQKNTCAKDEGPTQHLTRIDRFQTMKWAVAGSDLSASSLPHLGI
jgi:hypothetical protein